MKLLITFLMMMNFAHAFSTRGLDHVGITVPKLTEAKKFFEIFGCVEVSTIGPFEMANSMSNDRKSLTKPRAKSLTLNMLDCGDGSKIELFEYKNSKGKTTWSDHEDLGAQHIAFYTENLQEGIALLKSKGVTVIGEPMTMTSGDTSGETWVHFMAPWGLEMELVEAKKGKKYEEKFMNVNKVIEEHFKSINELNAKQRIKSMNAAYAKTIRFVDPFFEVTGIPDLEKMYDKLHEKFPQHTFKVAQVDLLKDSVRIKWELVNKENKKVHTGEDIMILQSGKIQTLYVFIDKEEGK